MNKRSFREKAFWILDSIKGRKIRSHYNNIAFVNNADFKIGNTKRIASLNALLEHAVRTTPYYKKFNDYRSINDFPVIKKTEIQENFEQFRSEHFLNRKNYKVATSGSTGVPFFLYQDVNKKLRNSADTLYFLSKSNFQIGDRLYDIEVWRDINKNHPLKAWMQNLVYIDSSKFNQKEIENLIKRLTLDASPKCLIGFVSALELICKYLEASDIDSLYHLNVKSIIANSEYLTSYVKTTMEKYFGAPVVSRYSNEELGIMAHQLPGSDNSFKINWASYHFEILKMNSDQPASLNEMGRIVVTDIFNYAMPMIRYDTGDIAMFNTHLGQSNNWPVLKRVEGRRMDAVYNTKGELVSSFLIYTKFYEYYELLKQFQFIQTGQKSYLIKLNTHSGSFKYTDKLIKNVKSDFGEDADVTIKLVDEIPPLSSGKRKKVVNRLHKSKSV